MWQGSRENFNAVELSHYKDETIKTGMVIIWSTELVKNAKMRKLSPYVVLYSTWLKAALLKDLTINDFP